MPRPLAAACALSLLAAACADNPCKEGTVFLSVQLAASAAGADHLAVGVALAGGGTTVASKPHQAGTTLDTFELRFAAGYPAGQRITVFVVANAAGVPIARGSAEALLPAGCLALPVQVGGEGGDGAAVQDLGPLPDLGAPDAAPADGPATDAGPADADSDAGPDDAAPGDGFPGDAVTAG